MAVVNTFVSDYLTAPEATKLMGKPPGPIASGRIMMMDYPIKAIDKFIAVACARMNYNHYGGFALCVANEGAAVVAALLAAGYTPLDIIGLRSSGTFNPIELIEGNQKLPDKLHIQKKGADHKGLHFRDHINELLRAKIPGDAKAMVTFTELHNARAMPLHITALDISTAGIVPLSFSTFPMMPVADAVLASCAVQPYISQVVYKTPEGETHTFMACGQSQTLPFQTVGQLVHKLGMGPIAGLIPKIEGFGYLGTENPAGAKNASGSELYKVLLAQRAQAVFPDAAKSHIHLI